MSLAVVFPGQGSVSPGAGRPWCEHPAWHIVTDAEAVTGCDLAHLLLDADAETLGETWAGQLSVLLLSLMAWEAIAEVVAAREVTAMAGHSLGQITALFADGIVDFDGGMRLALSRAEVSRTAAQHDPGRMAAVLGADLEQVEAICDSFADVWIAIDNAPGQIVIAGRPAALDDAIHAITGAGAGRPKLLMVGHAFHTPLLTGAAEQWRAALAATTFTRPDHPIVTNHDAHPHTDAQGWPDRLTSQLTGRVRWRESQLTLADLGATDFVEVGPGRVLGGLAKRTIPQLTRHHVSTPEEAESFAAMTTTKAATR